VRILGIDPGLAITGWGVIDSSNRGLTVVGYGSITTKPALSQPERLFQLVRELDIHLDEYKPEVAAIEQLFFNRNVTSAFAVGQARGAMLVSLAQRKMPINEYTPLQVKLSITGNGRAPKTQVGFMVRALLGLTQVPKPDDTADALAIAICHAAHAGNRLQRALEVQS